MSESGIVFDSDLRKSLRGVDGIRIVTEFTGNVSDKGKEIHNYTVYKGSDILLERKAYKGVREDGTVYFMILKAKEEKLSVEDQQKKISLMQSLFQ